MKPSFFYIPVLFVALCFGMMFAATDAANAQETEARAQLEKTVDAVLRELQKPGMKASPEERKAILAEVERIVEGLFDFQELSRRTVGRGWRNFTPDQRSRFQEAFMDLLREVYLEKLTGYNGERVTFLGENPTANGKGVEIHTTVMVKDKPVPVSYRMLKKDRWVVYDVVIEGSISMAENYNSQFRDLLARGDAESLIRQVEQKALEMKEFNRKEQAK